MKYTLGIDYGTLSGRTVLVEAATGKVVDSLVYEYPRGVLDRALPDGTPLPPNWALQHPGDYLQVLDQTVPPLLARTGIRPEQVVGIGVDFTSATLIPLDSRGQPLCLQEAFAREPHAWPKLWKHHAAQDQANRMTRLAEQRQEPWLACFGNQISCEFSFPKLWEVVEKAPAVAEAMDHWMEAGDWLVWQLTGNRVISANPAGFKAFWQETSGYPDRAFFEALDPRLPEVMDRVMTAPVIPAFSRAGALTEEMAGRLGLCPGTAVAAAMIDAHAFLPTAGITGPGKLLAIMGTSSCYMALSDRCSPFRGVCSVVKDGLLPGYWGYEAGQGCVGDHFAWVAEQLAPEEYRQEARRRGISIHSYLTELAQAQKPGAHGLVALDWWNGNRSILMDGALTGLILGLTLQTRAEDIYRCLIEATAFGARIILESFNQAGIASDALYATGGICAKNPMLMQIYADVLGIPVRVIDAPQGGALGSAIIAAAVAGLYPDPRQAIEAMSAPVGAEYLPIAENAAVYDTLYGIFRRLHDRFAGEDRELIYQLGKLRGL